MPVSSALTVQISGSKTFSKDGEDFEQHEIEFLPVEPDEAVEQLLISKWILRMLGSHYGVEVSFAPKITVGEAGSGMHIHMMLEKDGNNIMIENGTLSEPAKKMIAGVLDMSKALTAFGNTIPTSYLRLVPDQEAPTNILLGRSQQVSPYQGSTGMEWCDEYDKGCKSCRH